MSTTRKKMKKNDKSNKKKTDNLKGRVEPKDGGEVCIIADVTLVKRIYSLDDECCCLI